MLDNVPTPLAHSVLVIFAWVWNALADPLMRSRAVEVVCIFADGPLQMAFVQDQHMIQTFPPHAADEALAYCVGFRRSDWRPQHFYPTVLCHTVETLPILPVVVTNQKAWPFFIGRGFSHLLRVVSEN